MLLADCQRYSNHAQKYLYNNIYYQDIKTLGEPCMENTFLIFDMLAVVNYYAYASVAIIHLYLHVCTC